MKELPNDGFSVRWEGRYRPRRDGLLRFVLSGDDGYRLFVNGREITKGLLAPYTSNVDHIVYFDEYDLTDLLLPGKAYQSRGAPSSGPVRARAAAAAARTRAGGSGRRS